VKSKEEVLRRLKKLRARYLRQYLRLSQDRLSRNCTYNHEVLVHPVKSRISDTHDLGEARPIASARSLIVLQESREDTPVRVCLYGCKDPAEWLGELCYTKEKAESCGWFKPSKDLAEAEKEFDLLLSDDAHVYENYRDMAALQWVLEDRIHKYRPGLLERIWRWFIRSRSIPAPKLPPPISEISPTRSDAPPVNIDLDVLENPDFDSKLTNLFR